MTESERAELKDINAELLAALEPFAQFAIAFDAQPPRGIDDELYTIHGAASLRLSDCRKARAAIARARGGS